MKYFLLVALCALSVSMYGQVTDPCDFDDDSQNMPTNCPVINGSIIHNKQGVYYNCNQYVRGALVEGKVNLTTGKPILPHYENDMETLCQHVIMGDPNFIKVCNKSDADMLQQLGFDHSAIILENGQYAYTWDPGDQGPYVVNEIRQTPYENHHSGACNYEFYAAIPKLELVGPSYIYIGEEVEYQLINRKLDGTAIPVPAFLLFENDTWSVSDSQKIEIRPGSTLTTVKIKALPGSLNGTYDVINTLSTTATKQLCGPTPGNHGNYDRPTRIKSVTVIPKCNGKIKELPSGPETDLYTYNSVSYNKTYEVNLSQQYYTWIKNYGNISYSLSNYGSRMTFSMPMGCANFNVYGSGCSHSFTFCAYSPPPEEELEGPELTPLPYKVLSLSNAQLVKQGEMRNENATKEILQSLPRGGYIIYVNGQAKKYWKRD